MSRLDDRLKDALRREAPPAGFEARLMARIEAEPEPATGLARWFRLPQLRLPMMTRLAFAAVLCLMVVAGVRYEQVKQEREAGEAAKQKLMLALRVTGTQLQAVHEKVMSSLDRQDAE
jgi:negative regulator of sigma E activity